MNTDQIAVEAADAICDMYHLAGYKDILPVIKSAIEKARDSENLLYRYHNEPRFHQFVERMCYESIESYKSRTAHASKRTTGEWTCGGDDIQPAHASEHCTCDENPADACPIHLNSEQLAAHASEQGADTKRLEAVLLEIKSVAEYDAKLNGQWRLVTEQIVSRIDAALSQRPKTI